MNKSTQFNLVVAAGAIASFSVVALQRHYGEHELFASPEMLMLLIQLQSTRSTTMAALPRRLRITTDFARPTEWNIWFLSGRSLDM
eukprot:758469-Hanusia_phi.AAC.2